LLGLASPLVLIDDQARHEAKDVGGASLWAHLEVSARDDLLGRGRHGRGAVTVIGGRTG